MAAPRIPAPEYGGQSVRIAWSGAQDLEPRSRVSQR
jgi:hypothetical protein